MAELKIALPIDSTPTLTDLVDTSPRGGDEGLLEGAEIENERSESESEVSITLY
jgi:hypothetical protein